MKNLSVKNLLKERIKAGKAGQIYFAQDFIDIANNEQVRLALSRLTKEGFLLRLSQGIYLYPKEDSLLGKVKPSLEAIAQAIAQRDKITIKPTGAYALNRIGLSTQVPMKVVYLTNGESRKIKVGKNIITFKNTTSKKMAYKGEISPLIILALEEIGPSGVTEVIMKYITQMLKKEDFNILLDNLKLAPRWIADLLLPLLNPSRNV
jgi:predicted transcriptional regulator of viral defense system